jgi:FkbM family methyltransferase
MVQEQEVRFFVRNPYDDQQGVHYRGFFYELGVLEALQKIVRPGIIFLDVGANIGNHTLFAEKFLGAGEVIAIEPNPDAIEILRLNIALNGLRRVNLQHLGFALSDAAESFDITVVENNIGWATLNPSEGGAIRSVVGDDLFAERPIDFIKIDVETMEMHVLRGLARTIARNRPLMFIEVDVENRAAFELWLRENRYRISGRTEQKPKNQNFLVEPLERPAAPL